MTTKIPPLKPRNYGILASLLGITATVGLWQGAFTFNQRIGGLKPVNQGQQQGYALYVIEKLSDANQFLFWTGAACLGGVVTMSFIPISKNETLLNLETIDEDLPESLYLFSLHSSRVIAEITSWLITSTGKTVKKYSLTFTPPTVKTWLQEAEADASWFSKFMKAPHKRVAGRTRSGKYFIVCQLICEYREKFPDGKLTICDINYGKPGNDRELSDWMGISPEFIFSDKQGIEAAVHAHWTEMMERKTICEKAVRERRKLTGEEQKKVLQPSLLVFDELDSTLQQFGKDSSVLEELNQTLSMGGGLESGYRHGLILCGQSLSVDASSIKLSTTDQMSTCLVMYGRANKEQIRKLGELSERTIERLSQILDKGKRAALVQLDGSEVQAVVVPDLSDLKDVRFEAIEDSDTRWWREIFTQEVQLWMEELANRYARSEIPSPLKTIAAKFNCETRSTDERYIKFVKPTWEQILNKAKQSLGGN